MTTATRETANLPGPCPGAERMVWPVQTHPAQSTGPESKRNSGDGEYFSLDFSFYRTRYSIHHQRIAFPTPDRVAQPRRLRVDRKLASVCIYLAVRVIRLVQDHDQARRLNDLERGIREDVSARDAQRKTVGRIITASGHVLAKQFGGLGPNGCF